MNERILRTLYMYALIQVFIMVERFADVEVAGLGAGTQFC